MSVEIPAMYSMDDVRAESFQLYQDLSEYIQTVPGGPWAFVYGYDPHFHRETYCFEFIRLGYTGPKIVVSAERVSDHYKFSFKESGIS